MPNETSVWRERSTLLLIENDLDVAVPIALALQEAGYCLLQAGDGHRGLQLARKVAPDLVLAGRKLPRMDGPAVCRALRRESAVPIVMLVAREEEGVRALEVGSDGYLLWPVERRELLARVGALLRRRALDGAGAGLPQEWLAVGEIVVDRTTRQAWRAGRPLRLRQREFELLCVLMEHAGRAISRQELLARVWGEDWTGDPRTLDVHVRWLRQKLEEDPSAPRYIQTLRGYGHRFVAAPVGRDAISPYAARP